MPPEEIWQCSLLFGASSALGWWALRLAELQSDGMSMPTYDLTPASGGRSSGCSAPDASHISPADTLCQGSDASPIELDPGYGWSHHHSVVNLHSSMLKQTNLGTAR